MRNSIIFGAAAVIVVVLIGMWIASPDPVETTTLDGNEVVSQDPDVIETTEVEPSGSIDTDTTALAEEDAMDTTEGAADEEVAEIADEDAATDEGTDVAAVEGEVDAEALQPETFDLQAAIEAVENSNLTESEQQAFVISLENAENDPEQLEVVLEDLRTALNIE